MEAIQGRIAGMDITRSSGGAGSGVNILIRGTKTIGYTDMFGNKTRNTEPLFIIDGVQGGSYSDLNPNDIESIDVLKDASSTAIYGSLGANGVVIITTKKGKDNKVNVSLDSYYGVNGFVDYPTPRTGESYMNVRREAFRSVGQWETTADDFKIFSNEEWTAIQDNKATMLLSLQEKIKLNHTYLLDILTNKVYLKMMTFQNIQYVQIWIMK